MSRSSTPEAVIATQRSVRTVRRGWVIAGAVVLLVAAAAGGLRWRTDQVRQTAGLHAARGVELREAGDLPGAVRELQTATRLDPANGQAWYLLAKAQEEQKTGGGLASYVRAAELAPANPDVQRDAGLALHEAGETDRARTMLKRAVELAPTDQAAYAGLGRAYLARVTGPEDLRLGIEALTTALDLQPGDVQTRYRLGRALYQAEDLDGAREQFRTTLDLLAEGARASTELMDGRSFDSVTWLSVVKGCHHNLAQIAGRRKQPEIAAAHQKRFDDMNRYIRETYSLFTALKERPEDSAAQRRLRELYVRFGLPATGPTGRAAADRWIDP